MPLYEGYFSISKEGALLMLTSIEKESLHTTRQYLVVINYLYL